MSKRNAFDLTCAQEVFRINRDEKNTIAPAQVSIQPKAVARRRDGIVTRVTTVPESVVAQNKINHADNIRETFLPRTR